MDFSKLDIELIDDDAQLTGREAGTVVTDFEKESKPNNLFVSDDFVFEQVRTLMISCGNGGGNMLKHNVANNICGDVENFITDTDYIALKSKNISGSQVVLFGEKECKGKGAGTHPEVAEKAALESEDKIRHIVAGAGLVFLIAGEGGGTGTGCSPVVAKIAKEAGAIVVAIVTKPFKFEGKTVMNRAIEGINKLRENVDAIMVVDNQKVLSIGEANIPWVARLRKIDDFVGGILSGFVNVTRDESIMKLDFNDIKYMFETCTGNMFIGAGESEYMPMSEQTENWDGGERAMMEAVENAISSPLIDGINLSNAKGVIALYLVGEDVSLEALEKAQERINDAVGNDEANIIFGANANSDMNGKIKVFFILAGLNEQHNITDETHFARENFKNPVYIDKGEKIDMFDITNDAMHEDRIKPSVGFVPVSQHNNFNVNKSDEKLIKDIFGKTEKISSIPEKTKQEDSRAPKFMQGGMTGSSFAQKDENNSEKKHTPSILGIEEVPPFLRTQCQ